MSADYACNLDLKAQLCRSTGGWVGRAIPVQQSSQHHSNPQSIMSKKMDIMKEYVVRISAAEIKINSVMQMGGRVEGSSSW